MADRWPSSARVNAADPECTIIVRSTTGVTCRAHADRAAEAITFEAGGPYDAGNGHPAEEDATHWGRCPACERLFLRVPNLSAWAKVSHRVDLRYIDEGLDLRLIDETFLNEGSPDASQHDSPYIRCGTIAGTKRSPVFRFEPIAPQLPPGSRIIMAQAWVYLSNYAPAATFTVHRVLRDDADIQAMTWNSYKDGAAWATPGGKGSGTDRAADSLASSSPGAIGWHALLSGSTFTAEVEARKATAWAAVFVEFDYTGSFACHSMVSANKPYLRLWYERPAVDVGED